MMLKPYGLPGNSLGHLQSRSVRRLCSNRLLSNRSGSLHLFGPATPRRLQRPLLLASSNSSGNNDAAAAGDQAGMPKAQEQVEDKPAVSAAGGEGSTTFSFNGDKEAGSSSSSSNSTNNKEEQQQQQQQSSSSGNGKGSEGEVEDEGPPSPVQQQQQQQQQQQEQKASDSPWKELAAAMTALAAFFRSAGHGILALLNRLPLWMQQQHLKKLREAAEEDPKNADKHASLLSELNKVNPREVITRVESKQYASGAAVVAEYLRALVITGKLADYASTAPPDRGEDHRSMSQLLREMQTQVATEEQDDVPGSSLRRPLHVTVQGGQVMQMNKPTGPLQAVWALLTTVMLIVGMAFLWLVGSQAMRRMQASSPNSAAAVGSAAGSSSGSPSLDPKEYKKEELPEKSVKSFRDVRGCDEAKEELQEVVEFLKNPAKFTRLGAKLPKGVLLTGPPGTGKTLLARAVAGEAGVPFFYRAGSEFEELYVGVGSRRMRALFQAAKKKAPCIVFIDEIDAIGGNRKHWENHARKTLNQLLVEMDGFESNEGVIVMAATNLAETLDPALKRPGRFDRQVAVPLPDIKGRTELIEYYLHDKPFAADVDRDVLARQTQGFSGADISNLINEAALSAAKEGADIIAPHMLDQAFDKIRMGVERKSVRRSEQARKRTAYHEAGHAIVALHTPGASPIHKATIVPRGHALGMVSQVGRDDEFSINRQQMLARIWVCMGGQVAEELMFGRDQVTTGATDDLRQATDMARYMVSECGMNDVVGPMYVSEGDSRHNVLSETVKERIDAQVRNVLVEARTGVMELLQSHVTELHSLAGALIEVETLTSKQINALLGLGTAEEPSAPGSSGSSNGGSGSDKQKDPNPLDPAGVLAPGVPVPTAQVPSPPASSTPSTSTPSPTPDQHHPQASMPSAPLSATSSTSQGRAAADGNAEAVSAQPLATPLSTPTETNQNQNHHHRQHRHQTQRQQRRQRTSVPLPVQSSAAQPEAAQPDHASHHVSSPPEASPSGTQPSTQGASNQEGPVLGSSAQAESGQQGWPRNWGLDRSQQGFSSSRGGVTEGRLHTPATQQQQQQQHEGPNDSGAAPDFASLPLQHHHHLPTEGSEVSE